MWCIVVAFPLDGSYLHLSRLQWVVVTGPCHPFDAVCEWSMWTSVVEAVQIRHVAGFVPPGSFERHGTVAARIVVISVVSAELLSQMVAQWVTCRHAEASVDNKRMQIILLWTVESARTGRLHGHSHRCRPINWRRCLFMPLLKFDGRLNRR